MKKWIVSLFLSLAVFGCTSYYHPAMDDTAYLKWLDDSWEVISVNKEYRRLPIDTTEDEDLFMDKTHKAFRKEISKEQFIQEMQKSYPGHSKSIQILADQLPK